MALSRQLSAVCRFANLKMVRVRSVADRGAPMSSWPDAHPNCDGG